MAYQNYTPYYQPNFYNSGAMPDQLNQIKNSYQTPMQMSQPQPQTQAQTNNGLIWVQGLSAAKSFLVAPNTTVMLMDSEGSRFYLKSADASGMPLPLRTFEYAEVSQNGSNLAINAPVNDFNVDLSNYVTFDQLNEILENKAQPQLKKPTTKKATKEGADNE